MQSLAFVLPNSDQTERLGASLAQLQPAPAIIYLRGELGAGKTTFSRGYLRAAGHPGAVKSPTYTLIEPYTLPGGKVFHLDLYRLGDPAELEFLGQDDLIAEGGVCLIEWPERGQPYLAPADLTIHLSYGKNTRRALLSAHHARAEAWLRSISTHFHEFSHLKD